jgi:hypothetical protein
VFPGGRYPDHQGPRACVFAKRDGTGEEFVFRGWVANRGVGTEMGTFTSMAAIKRHFFMSALNSKIGKIENHINHADDISVYLVSKNSVSNYEF